MRKAKTRALGDKFLYDLKGGILARLKGEVQTDTSLCLEMRGSYISVYYRGGNLIKVEEANSGYSATFDKNYFKNGTGISLPDHAIREKDDTTKWLDAWPRLKYAMDRYFGEHNKDEREFQQSILRDNNFGSVARFTDYYICDIEYQSEYGRFDMIAAHWPSDRHVRKKTEDRRFVIAEVKHGDSALDGTAGLHAHINAVNGYLDNSDNVRFLKEDMVRVFNQKRELGLIDCQRNLHSFSDEKPLFLLAFVNHDPAKTKLRDLLKALPECPNAELRIVTASFLGYGLYDEGVHTVDKAFQHFGKYIQKDWPYGAGPGTQNAIES